jgi:hypothetical protein
MTPRLAAILLMLAAYVVSVGGIAADEPASPGTASTTPSTTTTTPSSTTTPTHKPSTTNVINAKVEKISDTSLTVKVTYQTGGNKPNEKPNPKNKVHTVVKSITYQIGEIPPVKIMTDGAHPTRTTGSYADVKVGDMVTLGTGPASIKTADGKTTTHTQITGIDVLKHPATTTTTTAKPSKE